MKYIFVCAKSQKKQYIKLLFVCDYKDLLQIRFSVDIENGENYNVDNTYGKELSSWLHTAIILITLMHAATMLAVILTVPLK